MAKTPELAARLPRESRWPVMPFVEHRKRMPPGTKGPNRLAASNGPMIEVWEKLFLGMTLVGEDAALTIGAGEGSRRSFYRHGLRGNLVFVVRHAPEGSALSRLPIEILDQIDQMVYHSVCGTKSITYGAIASKLTE
jgi:hypothetical protein